MARKWPLIVVGAGLMVASAWAQQYPQGQKGQTGQYGQEKTGQYTHERGMRQTEGTYEPGTAVKSKDVIGKTVWDSQNNKLGDLENVVIDMNTGQALFGILNGRHFGKNDQYMAVPITAFTYREDKKGTEVNLTKDQLANGPTFSEKNWPNMTDKSFIDRVYSAYNMPGPTWRTGMKGQMHGQGAVAQGQMRGRTGTEGRMGQMMGSAPGTWAKATDLVGKNVRDLNENKLGDCQNLVMDFTNGHCLFAILPGDYVNKRDQDIAIPITALRFTEGQNYLVLNTTKEQLAQAPAFNERNWPNMTDRSFIDKVYAHFNVPSPYA
jgi:sporulation protein YlmC with PRC-barrel domain